MSYSLYVRGLLGLLCLVILLPFVVGAQVSDLRAVVSKSLAEDPASAELTSAEFETLVNALVAEAQKQGVAVSDFVDSAASTEIDVVASGDCAYPAFICAANEALGLSGEDNRLLISLGAAAGALALILAMALTRRHHLDAIMGSKGQSAL